MPLLAKVIAGVFVLVLIFLFIRLRDTSANNLRKAKSFHDEAASLHEEGNEEEARKLFEKSNYHREKAFEQMKVV